MRLINLTPHAIVCGDITVAPSGAVARVSAASQEAGNVGGIPLFRTTFGEVVGLPAQEEGVLLIVSAMVRTALPARTDLLSPGEPVRDAEGRVIGCKGLITN